MALRKFSTFKPEVESVVIPFLTSRILLVLTGYLAFMIRANDLYPIRKVVEQGWHFTPYRFLDMWARWDSGWYFNLVVNGLNFTEGQSNLAFFPLYPYLIRASNFFLLDFREHRTTFTILGILISNLAFIGALLVLRKILLRSGFTEIFSQGVIWLLLLHPFGFYFSAVYTEGLFLFLVMATMWFCLEQKWLLVAITAALLTISRPLAQFIVIPIAISYLVQNKGRIRWRDVISFAIVPLVFIGYAVALYLVSGDWLMLLNSHQDWGHAYSDPWSVLTYIDPNRPVLSMLHIAVMIATILLLLVYMWRYPHKEWGLLGLLLVITPLFLGISNSLGRYSLQAFVAMIALQGLLENRPNMQRLVYYLLFTVQILLFAGWVRFYWIS